MAAPSKDHLRGFSNASLIALLCILVVVAQAGLALQASALGRCGPYPPLRPEMQSTIKAKGQWRALLSFLWDLLFGSLRFLYSLELRDFSKCLDMPRIEMERTDSPIDTNTAIAGHRCHKMGLRGAQAYQCFFIGCSGMNAHIVFQGKRMQNAFGFQTAPHTARNHTT